jgi:RAB protein geranylgeranyltransferase component A
MGNVESEWNAFMMNKKRILLAVSSLFLCFVSYALAKAANKVNEIDTNDFYNSAHHWYDIYDAKNIINPEPNQPRYEPA